MGILIISRKKGRLFSTLKKRIMNKIKNIKISPESHELLKSYCNKHGFKIYKFLEKLIEDNCKKITDIYGDEL